MKEYDFERVGARELSPLYVIQKTAAGWELHTAEFFPGTQFSPAYYSLVWVREIMRTGVCMPTLWTLLEVLDGLGYQIKIERKKDD